VLTAAYLPGNVWADPIRLTSQTSLRLFGVLSASAPSLPSDELFVFGDVKESSDSLGPVTLDRAIFGGDGAASATITSVVQPSIIRVSGSTAAEGHEAALPPGSFITDFTVRVDARARLDAAFTLADPHLFDLSPVRAASGSGSVSAFLTDVTRGTIFSVGGGALSGTLAPGDYRLSVELASFADASSRFPRSESGNSSIDLSFALSPVAATPEPASLVLLSTGVAGLLRRTRNREDRPPRQ
jgi:hypothetical protein